MDWLTRLTRWLSRHPVKEPADTEAARFTVDVMARVRALERPHQAPAPAGSWLPWLRPVLVTAAAAAVIAVAATSVNGPRHPQEQMLVIAEEPAANEQWLDETLELLDAFDEELPEEPADAWSDQDLQEELQLLEEAEQLASS